MKMLAKKLVLGLVQDPWRGEAVCHTAFTTFFHRLDGHVSVPRHIALFLSPSLPLSLSFSGLRILPDGFIYLFHWSFSPLPDLQGLHSTGRGQRLLLYVWNTSLSMSSLVMMMVVTMTTKKLVFSLRGRNPYTLSTSYKIHRAQLFYSQTP